LTEKEAGEGKGRGIIAEKGGGLRNMGIASGIGVDRGTVGVRKVDRIGAQTGRRKATSRDSDMQSQRKKELRI